LLQKLIGAFAQMSGTGLHTLFTKSEARRTVVNRRKEFQPEELYRKSKLIIDRLIASDDFHFAKKIHTYIASRPGEIDTHYLIDKMEGLGKTIILPKLHKQSKKFHRANFMGWEHLAKNSDGYIEPLIAFDEGLSDIDLIIVPTIAVSLVGQRVGYGGGYYDSLLKQTHSTKIVLAFELQIFNYIETELHDVRIDKIITELRTINTRESLRKD